MKHVEIAKAWLEGKNVQVKAARMENWADIAHVSKVSSMPTFYDGWEYRIKPETVKYRRYLYQSTDGNKKIYSVSPKYGEWVETTPQFIRWIDTDWQEVEI